MALIHNILTCSGFAGSNNFFSVGDCMRSRLGIIVLFFIIALVRKWGGEEMGIDFNFLFSLIIGIGAYFIINLFTGNVALSLILGIVGALFGGYGMGLIWGGSDSGDDGGGGDW